MNQTIHEQQENICARFGVKPLVCQPHFKVGISRNVREGILPINGLRVKAEGDTTGWYIWAGEEWSDDPDFFVPLHVEHLERWCPNVLPYLSLPTGWRFLTAPDYEDVWFDQELAQKEGAS